MRVAEVGVGLSGELEEMGMSEGMRRKWCRERHDGDCLTTLGPPQAGL